MVKKVELAELWPCFYHACQCLLVQDNRVGNINMEDSDILVVGDEFHREFVPWPCDVREWPDIGYIEVLERGIAFEFAKQFKKERNVTGDAVLHDKF